MWALFLVALMAANACQISCLKDQATVDDAISNCEKCDRFAGCNLQCSIMCAKFSTGEKVRGCVKQCGCEGVVKGEAESFGRWGAGARPLADAVSAVETAAVPMSGGGSPNPEVANWTTWVNSASPSGTTKQTLEYETNPFQDQAMSA
jgi:hypothetical protein